MSERFAELLPAGTARPIGAHLLKGFAQPVDLYSLFDHRTRSIAAARLVAGPAAESKL